MAEKRLLVIGLDGATFEVIEPLAARGELPCIGGIAARGLARPLKSTVPPITPPAWSSFATGTPPSGHSVFGFTYPDAGDYSLRLNCAADLLRPTLWERLGRGGFPVLLLDVPFTYPPPPVNGAVVAGFPITGRASFTHPPDLAEKLESSGLACPPHPAEAPDPSEPGFLGWLDAFLDARLAIFRRLHETVPWRFAMVGTMALDWAQHALWKYLDPRFVFSREPGAERHRETLWACYRRVDRFVGDVIEVAGGDATVVLVSDHGFGTAFHFDWIGEALAKAGLLYWRKSARGPLSAVGAAALKLARSSPRLQRLGRRWLGDTGRARNWAKKSRSYPLIDWERTRIFPAGDYNLNLYVNCRSRFSRGIVEPGADYEKVLDAAVQALRAFKIPGQTLPLVRRVERIEGGAKGLPPRVPDLSLELNVLEPFPADHKVPAVAGICGFHSPEGIFITDETGWWGEEIPGAPAIADPAAHILQYFGLAVDEEETAPLRERTVSSGADDSAAVIERLRDLGYLD